MILSTATLSSKLSKVIIEEHTRSQRCCILLAEHPTQSINQITIFRVQKFLQFATIHPTTQPHNHPAQILFNAFSVDRIRDYFQPIFFSPPSIPSKSAKFPSIV